MKVQNSAIHDYADKLNIPVIWPAKLDEESEINHLKRLKADLVVVVAYGKILPEKLLNTENLYFLNFHVPQIHRFPNFEKFNSLEVFNIYNIFDEENSYGSYFNYSETHYENIKKVIKIFVDSLRLSITLFGTWG